MILPVCSSGTPMAEVGHRLSSLREQLCHLDASKNDEKEQHSAESNEGPTQPLLPIAQELTSEPNRQVDCKRYSQRCQTESLDLRSIEHDTGGDQKDLEQIQQRQPA